MKCKISFTSKMTFLGGVFFVLFCSLYFKPVSQLMRNNVDHVDSLSFNLLRLFHSVFQVREMAATTLSGFLQCNFLSMDPPMQAHFEALCKTCLPKKRKRELGSIVDTIPSAGGETKSFRIIELLPNCSETLIFILVKA